jgi:hypothetical protein
MVLGSAFLLLCRVPCDASFRASASIGLSFRNYFQISSRASNANGENSLYAELIFAQSFLIMGNVREMKERQFHPNQIVTLSDLEVFKTDLLLSIKALLNESRASNQKKWLKSYEVKKLLNISNGTLQTLRSNGTLPFSKIGGIIYYDADEINKVVEKQMRQSRSDFDSRQNSFK